MLPTLYTRHQAALATIIKNISAMVVLRAIQKSLGLITVYFLVRAISQEEFGQYQFLMSAFGILGIFNLSGLDNAIMQSTSRGFLGTYRRAVKLAFSCSLLASLCLLGYGVYEYSISPEFGLAFFAAALLFPFAFGLSQWKSIIIGQEKFGRLLQQEGLTAIITNILLITLLINGVADLALLIASFLLIPALQNMRMTYIAWRLTKNNTTHEEHSIRYGLKTSAYMVVSQVADQIERVLIFFTLSAATLGLYAAADRLAELVRGGVQDLAAVLAPKFAKTSHYSQQLDRMTKLFCAALGAGIILFAFTLAPWVLTTIFGAQYVGAVPYLQALLCAVAVGNVGQIQFRFIRSQLDVTNFRNILLSTSLYRILAACILVPLYGLWGVIISVFSYRIIMSVLSTLVIKKHYFMAKPHDQTTNTPP